MEVNPLLNGEDQAKREQNLKNRVEGDRGDEFSGFWEKEIMNSDVFIMEDRFL